MNHTEFFLILAAIYLAPSVSPRLQRLTAIAFTTAAAVTLLAKFGYHI
ncbi:hypothetical protein [Hydrogenophaga atypica]|uniref:Uncharacterized protein n=1 Tax=Hydrogenophaga atypica TaxID=249409 RepID=A0ABW2QKT7_9BURK